MKVFNLGFPKTGTTSFEEATEILGLKTYHGNYQLKHNDYLLALYIYKDFQEIKRMSQYWDAFADAPWGGTKLYEKLVEWYPEAKFVYTKRNPENWCRSLIKMLTRFDSNLDSALSTYHATDRYGFTNFIRSKFEIEELSEISEERIIEHFIEHENETLKFFHLIEKEILVFNPIDDNHGWSELCEFLELSVPSVPYPHKNKYEDSLSNQKKPERGARSLTTNMSRLKKFWNRL